MIPRPFGFVLRLVVGSILVVVTQTAFAGAPAPQPGMPPREDPSHDLVVITVVDAQGRPTAGVEVFSGGALLRDERPERDGQIMTDSNGELHVDTRLVSGTPVALAPQTTVPLTDSGRHCTQAAGSLCRSDAPWSYRIYQTNLRWDASGNATPVATAAATGWRLTLQQHHPLVLFNVVVSLDWSATANYRESLAKGFRLGSEYLFDLTDGQMAFGRVDVHDNRAEWDTSDVHLTRNNTVCPKAPIGGMTAVPRVGAIELSPYWDGRYTSGGDWGSINGYRTLVHEFAHYALGLEDEYKDSNENKAYCTDLFTSSDSAADERRASAMADQRYATEFGARTVEGLWSEACEHTKQFEKTGQSDWETIATRFADTVTPARWILETPMDRNAIMAGPNPCQWPTALPHWPVVAFSSDPDAMVRDIQIKIDMSQCQDRSASKSRAWVQLQPGGTGTPIDLGKMSASEQLTVPGVRTGDMIGAIIGECRGTVTVGESGQGPVFLSVKQGGKVFTTGVPTAQDWRSQNANQGSPFLVEQPIPLPGPSIPQVVVAADGTNNRLPLSIGNALDFDLTNLPDMLDRIAAPGLSSGNLYLVPPPPSWISLAQQPLSQFLGTYLRLSPSPSFDEIVSSDGRFSLVPLAREPLGTSQQNVLLELPSTPSLELGADDSVTMAPTQIQLASTTTPAVLILNCVSGPATPAANVAVSRADAQDRTFRVSRYDYLAGNWEPLETPVLYNDAARSLSFTLSESGTYAIIESPDSKLP